MSRVGIITQARMTSTRLPGKVLRRAGGKSMLAHHVERLRLSGFPVYIATTTNPTDDPIVAEAGRLGVECFRGSEEDVLGRFAGTADTFGLTTVVRVTSDCPLIDGALVAEGIRRYDELADPLAYVSNVLRRTYPRGYDFEVFDAAALYEAAQNATEPAQREHVTPYINQNVSGRVRRVDVIRNGDASRFRLTLDTAEDLRALTTLIEDHAAGALSGEDIIALLTDHPEVVEINAGVHQKPIGQ